MNKLHVPDEVDHAVASVESPLNPNPMRSVFGEEMLQAARKRLALPHPHRTINDAGDPYPHVSMEDIISYLDSKGEHHTDVLRSTAASLGSASAVISTLLNDGDFGQRVVRDMIRDALRAKERAKIDAQL